MALDLSAENGRIFRITHINNVPWILANGLYCRNSSVRDPDFARIGNDELIDMRTTRVVGVGPGGTLADYIPFYFTPHSPMLLNIKTGYRGVRKLPNSEIVILVSSIHTLQRAGHPFVYTDRHAYLRTAQFFTSVDNLGKIDWTLLRSRDFRRDPDDPDKFARYEAEALIYGHLPIEHVTGIVCHGENEKRTIEAFGRAAGVEVKVAARPGWYF